MHPSHPELPRPRLQRDPNHHTYPQLRVDASSKNDGSLFLATQPILVVDTRDDAEGSIAAALAVAFTRRQMAWGGGPPTPVEGQPVSRHFIQYNARALKGDAAKNANVRIFDGIRALQRYGVCSEDTWPSDPARLVAKPSAEAYDEAKGHEIDLTYTVPVNLDAMRYCISLGHAFVFILDIDLNDFTDGEDGNKRKPTTKAGLTSHVMCCFGYDDSGFRVHHSLGDQFDSGGNCTIPYDWMTDPEACSDIWMLRRASDLDLDMNGDKGFPKWSGSAPQARIAVPTIKVNGIDRVLSHAPVTPQDRPMLRFGTPGTPLPDPPAAAKLLRDHCPPIEQQGNLISCVAHAFTSALEFLSLRDGVDDPLSRLFLHWATREVDRRSNDKDDGVTIGSTVMAFAKHGVCRESLWPYDESKLNQRPTPEALADAATQVHGGTVQLPTLRAIKLSIASGFPVMVSFGIARSADDAADGTPSDTHRTGSFPLPTVGDPSTGRHFCLAVAYDDAEGKVTIANSWGDGWGKKGYGDLGYAFFGPTQDTPLERSDVSAGDAWTVRPAANILDLLAPASNLVIHGPHGLRVEGATIANVAELVRKLE